MTDQRKMAEVRCVVARLHDAREALFAAEKAAIDAKCYAEDFALDEHDRRAIEDVDALLKRAGTAIDAAVADMR